MNEQQIKNIVERLFSNLLEHIEGNVERPYIEDQILLHGHFQWDEVDTARKHIKKLYNEKELK